MSYIERLISQYHAFVSLPWQDGVAPPQRVWMAVYPPKDERRLRLNLPAFGNATKESGHPWGTVDITDSFEAWMANHEYAESFFEDPDLLTTALPNFFKALVEQVKNDLSKHPAPDGVVSLVGAGSLFGLGDSVKVSALLYEVNEYIAGRLLVLFPGEHENNNYRLLDARDGWDYLAICITAEGATK